MLQIISGKFYQNKGEFVIGITYFEPMNYMDENGNLNRAGKAGVEDLELGGDVGDDALCDLGRGLGGSYDC